MTIFLKKTTTEPERTGTALGPDHQKGSRRDRRRVMPVVLAFFASLFYTASLSWVGASPAVAASRPMSTGSDPISSYSAAPIATDRSGFATVGSDQSGDLYLFTKAFGGSKWSKTLIYLAGTNGLGLVSYPDIATNGKEIAIVALLSDSAGTDLFSWMGSPSGSFTEEALSSDGEFPLGSPSIAYSSLGKNFVVSATDNNGNLFYWYSTNKKGGWSEQQVASSSGNDYYSGDSAITVTDQGVVIADSVSGDLVELWYQPFGGPTWTLNGSYNLASEGYANEMESVWTGSQVDVVLSTFSSESSNVFLDVLTGISDTGTIGGVALLDTSSTETFEGSSIAWSGTDVVVSNVDSDGDLYFYHSDAGNSSFTQELLAPGSSSLVYNPNPGVAVGDSTYQVTDAGGGVVYDWSQDVGSNGWTRQKVGK